MRRKDARCPAGKALEDRGTHLVVQQREGRCRAGLRRALEVIRRSSCVAARQLNFVNVSQSVFGGGIIADVILERLDSASEETATKCEARIQM
jgi:hypothetical protein